MTDSDGKQSNPHPGGATMSIWQGTVELPHYARLGRSTTTDVCVIGAGIAGLSVAYHLAREGKKVVVVDDGPIGGGETGRTTAHLTDAMDDRIYWLEETHGADAARLFVESHGAAINRIQQIAQLEHVDCEFERLDGYLLAHESGDPGGRNELMREAVAAQRAGLTDVALVERAPIAGFESGTALRFPGQAQFNVLKYVIGVANAIVERYGGRIFCDTHVEGVEPGDPCTVKVEGGKTITAGCVVVCTNASITDYVQTHVKSEAHRTYAIAAVVPRGAVDKALYWDTATPYHYVRVAALSAPGGADAEPTKGDVLYDALIVGGEDHKVGHDADADERWHRLESWMRRRWPQAREVVYRWSGQVVEPVDGVAHIGRSPDGAENVFMASGDSGQGMTHGTVAGILLSDMILGRPNEWQAIYDPRRLPLHPAPFVEAVKHNADVAVQYAKGILSPDFGSPADVPVGEGRVIRRGAKRIAVYRDEHGQLHEKSAVCTHLKCTVEWNTAEKSWDCPCHGSRFSPTGEVLNGPAAMALEDVEPEASGASHRGASRRSRKTKA